MVATESIQKIGHPTLEVTKYGECPQVLFIHGCTETSAIWLPVMQELGKAGVESAAVDLRGHGGSDGHGSLQESGIEDYVADALSTLNAMPSLRIVVGHSMGGLVTQLLAAKTDLDYAVLIASSPVFGMRGDGLRMARKHPWTFLMSFLRRSFKRLYVDELVTRSLLFHARTPAATVRQFMSLVQEDSWRAGNEMNSILPDPRAVRCPITVIGGADDFMVSRASTDATASAYGVKPIYLEGCAHMVPLEADLVMLSQLIMSSPLRAQ